MTESIGQQLQQAREARSLTLEQVARTTHMRLHYLQALERGDFRALPSMAQARGFLRAYASFLGLNAEGLLKALGEEAGMAVPGVDAAAAEASAGTERIRPPAEVPDASGEQAAEIFRDVGQRLKHQRELLGLSITDVERHTHLRTHYLQALESGDLTNLPSPVQGRGMLKNYAAFLGLDPDPLLLRFAEGLQARLALKHAAQPKTPLAEEAGQPRRPSPLRRIFSGDLLIGGLLAISLFGFMIWGAIRVFALRSEQKISSTAPSVAEVLLATTTATQTETQAASQPAGTPAAAEQTVSPTQDTGESAATTETTGEEGGAAETTAEETGTSPNSASSTEAGGPARSVQVYVTVRQRAWMRATVDGKVEFDGRVIPGSAYQFSGNKQVEILTGNAAALQIFFNQQDQGPMGIFGQVIQRVYTPNGVQTPTPTVTPTASATPRSTVTPTGAATPTLQGIITATPVK